MAHLHERFRENAEGPFYVDAQCIDCDVCRSIAPDIFVRNDRGAHSYVLRRPETEEEREPCRERWNPVRWKPAATTAICEARNLRIVDLDLTPQKENHHDERPKCSD